MITTVSSLSALNAALKIAQTGDTIQLAPGVYTGLRVTGLNLDGVTVTSQDLSHEAVITDFKVSGSSGLTFQDLEFRADKVTGINFEVANSHDIHFQRLDVHGSMDGDPQNDGTAFTIRYCDNVSVEDSEFQQLLYAVSHNYVDHLTVTGNDIHDIRLDGIRGGGSSYLNISNNTFRDFYRYDTDHSDAIQFWNRDITVAAHDIVIANNSFIRGAGKSIQGVFFGDEDKIPYSHLTITGNLVAGGAINGITVEYGNDIVVKDNIVQGFSDYRSYIRVDIVDGAVVTGNYSNMINITSNATHVTASGNSTVPLATDQGAWAIRTWDAQHLGMALSLGGELTGDLGDNTLTGGDYADTLVGGGGNDVLIGGAGDDLYIFDTKPKIVEAVSGGIDTVRSSISFSLQANIEHLELTGTRTSTGVGNTLDNRITGNDSANILRGLSGSDTVGGAGGADTISGGVGNDLLTGGGGADTFSFVSGDGDDRIVDFGAGGEHDVIDVSDLLAGGVTASLVDSASGVTISFSNGDSIFVEGVHPASLHATATGWMI